MIVLRCIILLMAVIDTPVLLTLCASKRRDLPFLAATSGIVSLVLVCSVALILHITKTPITALSLAASHLLILCLVGAIALLRRPSLRIRLESDEWRLLLPGVAVLLLIIFPYTTFTGIDTYKWQDLASSIRVEASLPWLVHPLSLLGFTPRSYPSAYPIQLGTIQILGGLGIGGGFFVASVLTALLGTACAYCLGRQCFERRAAIIFALCYAMSPVFIRYTHWATGRGLFLALFPAFLALLVAKPTLWTWAGLIATGLLLCLAHKVGLIAVPLFIVLAVAGRLLPRRSTPLAVALCCLLPVLAAAAIVTPSILPFPAGQVAGLMRYSMTRFAWMVPLAAVGLFGTTNLLGKTPLRILFPAMLIAIPLAYERQMYGALLALPFVVLLAVQGALQICRLRPLWTTGTWRVITVLTLVGAITTVAHRSRIATPRPLRRAALFLEQHDPRGPFQVVAPGRARTQVQAYVSGCPRIDVGAGTNMAIRLPPPPLGKRSARNTVSAWINYGRGLFSISEVKTSWYGENPATYYFVINGEGTVPDGATRIYDEEEIAIYKRESK